MPHTSLCCYRWMVGLGERQFYVVPDVRDYYTLTVFTLKTITGENKKELRHKMCKYNHYFIREVITYGTDESLFKPLAPCDVKEINSGPEEKRKAVCDVFVRRDGVTYGITVQHPLLPGQVYIAHCSESKNGHPVQFEAVCNPEHLELGQDQSAYEKNDLSLLQPTGQSCEASVNYIAKHAGIYEKHEIEDISCIANGDQLMRYTDGHFMVENKPVEFATNILDATFDNQNFFFTTSDN